MPLKQSHKHFDQLCRWCSTSLASVRSHTLQADLHCRWAADTAQLQRALVLVQHGVEYINAAYVPAPNPLWDESLQGEVPYSNQDAIVYVVCCYSKCENSQAVRNACAVTSCLKHTRCHSCFFSSARSRAQGWDFGFGTIVACSRVCPEPACLLHVAISWMHSSLVRRQPFIRSETARRRSFGSGAKVCCTSCCSAPHGTL